MIKSPIFKKKIFIFISQHRASVSAENTVSKLKSG